MTSALRIGQINNRRKEMEAECSGRFCGCRTGFVGLWRAVAVVTPTVDGGAGLGANREAHLLTSGLLLGVKETRSLCRGFARLFPSKLQSIAAAAFCTAPMHHLLCHRSHRSFLDVPGHLLTKNRYGNRKRSCHDSIDTARALNNIPKLTLKWWDSQISLKEKYLVLPTLHTTTFTLMYIYLMYIYS